MKIEEIKVIVKLMAENDLTEFKIEAEEYNLCIKRGQEHNIIATTSVAAPAAAPAAAGMWRSRSGGCWFRIRDS